MSDPTGKTPPKNVASILSLLAALIPPDHALPGFLNAEFPDFGPNPFDDRGFRKPEFKNNPNPFGFPPLPKIPMPLPNVVVVLEKSVKTSVTLTRQQMIADLTPVFTDLIRDNAKDIASGKIPFKDFNLTKMPDEVVIQNWCDFCSDRFHDLHPHIEDVLWGEGDGMKEWISSR